MKIHHLAAELAELDRAIQVVSAYAQGLGVDTNGGNAELSDVEADSIRRMWNAALDQDEEEEYAIV